MSVYKYRAINAERQFIKGFVEASSVDSVIELLDDRDLIIVSLYETKRGLDLASKIPFFSKVQKKSLVIFFRQLSVMLAATVPIVQALRNLATQTDDNTLKEIINEMADDVDGGMKLSSAFGKHGQVFSNFYIAMIKSGETSGRLDKVLDYLATQTEKDYKLMSRIRGAMIYPIFIISALVSVGIVMIIFVVPKMTQLLKETGSELPFMTNLLIRSSDFMVSYWWLLLIIVGILIVLSQVFLRSTMGRSAWDKNKLKLPIFGNMFTMIIISRLSTSLSTLIKGGVPISRALLIASDVVNNEKFKELIKETVKEVEDGNSITTVFGRSKLVPAMMPQMLSVGERTGRMDEVLDKVGDFYSNEVDTTINSLTSLIEPMIMIILGVGVGVMVAAIIMPMFQIANSIA